jgi:hypothetical protein
MTEGTQYEIRVVACPQRFPEGTRFSEDVTADVVNVCLRSRVGRLAVRGDWTGAPAEPAA